MGEVNVEKCISLIIREPFDYTNWRKTLFKDKSVKELSSDAMKYSVFLPAAIGVIPFCNFKLQIRFNC